jgi:hypothetical protein
MISVDFFAVQKLLLGAVESQQFPGEPMRHIWTHKSVFALAALILISGCYGQPLSTREKGTLAGGVLGAGTGAIVGSAVGAPGAGAAIGGALGLGTGMLIGNELQNNEIAQRYTQRQVWRQRRELRHQRREIQRLSAEQETE